MKNAPIQEIGRRLGLSFDSNALVSGYQIDSRLVEENGLFFALKGGRTDGHEHLAEAKQKGALAAVVSSEYKGPGFGLLLLPVPDVIGALQGLAASFMEESRSSIVGITGSVGKTTTKEFIATLLEGKFKVGKTFRNYNTKLTYPLTLLNRSGDEEILVLELGMSEPKDIARLVSIAAPDIGVLTKIGYAHAAHFERGILDIAKYKAEIFSHPKTKKCIFYHGLYEYPEAIGAVHGKKVSFSLEDRTADYFFSPEYYVDERGVRSYRFDFPYPQAHLRHNFLAAVAVAREMKMEWDEINAQIGKLEIPKMRFEQYEKEGILFINDAYNANPESMKAALSELPLPKEGGKRIAVLGMMAEMGADHEPLHREIGLFAQKYVDHLLVFGKEAEPIYEAFQEAQKPAEQYDSFEALAARLRSLMRPGDVVLAKASRCVEMELLFQWL